MSLSRILELIVGPFSLGFAAAFVVRVRWPKKLIWVFVIGLALAVGSVVFAYFSSPRSSVPFNGCSDCGNYLGRFWEPQFDVFLAGMGYAFWILGIAGALVLLAGLTAVRRVWKTRER